MSSTWLGSSLVSVLYEIESFLFQSFLFFFARNDFHGRHSPRQVDPGDTGIYANVPSTFPRRTWCDRTNPWAEALSRNSSGQVQSVPKLGRFSRYPSLWACSAWYLLLGTLSMPPPPTHLWTHSVWQAALPQRWLCFMMWSNGAIILTTNAHNMVLNI